MQFYFDHPWYFPAFAILLVGAVAGGFALAHFQFLSKQRKWHATGLEAAIIGLFGLMLSFTFLAAHNATRDRNRMVHEHADAIADMRRNSLFMHPVLKTQCRAFLLTHLNAELGLDTTRFDRRDLSHEHMEDVMGAYLGKLLTIAQDSLLPPSQLERHLQDLNNLSSAYYRSYYGYEERIPRLIIDLLLLSALFIGLLVGFMNGMGGSELRQMITTMVFLLITLLTIRTVLDLNNPYRGGIQPEMENLSRLRGTLLESTR